MRKLSVFNQVSVDGFFKTLDGDVAWTHEGAPDAELDEWVAGNASSGGALLFGRVTFELMASFWPTPMAMQQMPIVAKQMNALPKIVFSRKLDSVAWENAHLVKGDLVTEMKRLKSEPTKELGGDKPITIMGSGSIVAQLSRAGLIDEYHVLVIPTILASGVSMFNGSVNRQRLTLVRSRTFKNGKVSLSYAAAKEG
jgi:dihydrofolate reductase